MTLEKKKGQLHVTIPVRDVKEIRAELGIVISLAAGVLGVPASEILEGLK